MSTTKRIFVIVGGLIFIALLAWGFLNSRFLLNSIGNPSQNTEENTATETLISEHNFAILRALLDFETYAKSGSLATPDLCQGGFLNSREIEMVNLSERLVRNRILSLEPLTYAKTQDEAGIMCATAGEKWALALPLNTRGENAEPNFHCIDSAGKSGTIWIDPENAECLPE